jgi:hypothetical protein
MGKLRYNKRLVQAIEDYETKTPSHFLLAYDCTNGGVQHFSTAFHAEKAMKACNVGGLKTVMDSHQVLADAFGLSRDDAKKANQPLFHGASLSTVAKSVGISSKEVSKAVLEAFGEEAFYIESIASEGASRMTAAKPMLKWTMPDGFVAQSIAYLKGRAVSSYGLTVGGEKQTKEKVSRDFPGLVDNNGDFDKETKTQGFFANITHSIDSYILRRVDSAITIHDNFLVHPNDMVNVISQFKGALLDSYDTNLYVSAMEQNNIDTRLYKQGKGTKAMLMKSNNFMIA